MDESKLQVWSDEKQKWVYVFCRSIIREQVFCIITTEIRDKALGGRDLGVFQKTYPRKQFRIEEKDGK